MLALGLAERLFRWVKCVLSEGYKRPGNSCDPPPSIAKIKNA